jgi:HAE1 family hydrophobic/amphiphilic exporter-1
MAAIAATFAIIAIFLPIAFIKGIIGKFLYQFGVTMSVAVALSLLEALTLTPMRCAQMLSVGRSSRFGAALDRLYQKLSDGYRRLLGPCLKVRWLILLLSVAGFLGSLRYAGRIPQEVVPTQDQSMLIVRLFTPTGSSLDYTESKLVESEKFLEAKRVDGPVNRYFSIIGGFGGGEVDQGIIFMTLKPLRERPINPATGKPITQQEFQAQVRGALNSIPGVKQAIVSDLSMRGLTGRGTQAPIQFVVSGPDWDKLGELTEDYMDRIRRGGLMVDVKSDYQLGMPELKILPDRKRAADLGVSVLSIGNTVNALVGGVRVAKFKEGGHRYDVRVRLQSDQRSRPEDINKLMVRNREGRLVRLSEVVQVFEQATVSTITRRNRTRAITIDANMAPGMSQKDAWEQIQEIGADLLPPGYTIDVTGASALFKDAGSSFLIAIGMGIIIAYMILASQFNSFVHPVLILLAMPFSLTGAIVALGVAKASFNMYSMIGIVLLMGIVKKNSILLVEFTNQMRERNGGESSLGFGVGRFLRALLRLDGAELSEWRRRRRLRQSLATGALLEACPIRLRPILMTSISTVAAAVPPALAIGPGAETRIPMAAVVIGGVLLSTILTLVVVPCAYLIMPGRVRLEESEEEPASEMPAIPASKPGP